MDGLSCLMPQSCGPEQGENGLKVGIIGAGIAGLGAAIALSRSGHHVEVFERSTFKREAGAAINSGPNATKILREWGFDFERVEACEVEEYLRCKGDTLEPMETKDMRSIPATYGDRYFCLHRVDLHNELRRLALDSPRVTINLGSEVIDVDSEQGTLTLVGGSIHHKDLIVAADGVHTKFARKVTGVDTPATRTGQSIFRFLIPTERLLADHTTRSLFVDPIIRLNTALAEDRRVVWYPCRGNKVQNFVAFQPDTGSGTEEWDSSASQDQLMQAVSNFHPIIQAVCRNADDIKLWPLLSREPLSTWTKGRLVLIGDAAHPTLPYLGQGAAQGIEDAAALGIVLSHLSWARNSVPSLLRQFESIRRARASAIQIFSSQGADQARRIQSTIAAKYVKDKKIPTNLLEFYDFLFSYDVVTTCMEEIAQKRIPL